MGGPTALIEFGGVRLLTDPTFDPAGGEYTTGLVTLRKLAGPALERGAVGRFDYILLSHDHHWDNLDHAGRCHSGRRKKSIDDGRRGANPAGACCVWSLRPRGMGREASAGERRSGDTVWYQGVVEVAQRFKVRVAMLHLGAARVPEVGTFISP